MTEIAKEAFASRNYRLALEMYERSLKQQSPTMETLFGYGDSLARCGRVRESLDIYSRCLALSPASPERLRHLTTALLDDLDSPTLLTTSMTTSMTTTLTTTMTTTMTTDTTANSSLTLASSSSAFTCTTCEGCLYQPVTSNCGHTHCRNCYEVTKFCRKCGTKNGPIDETNVLVQRLVEKWWPREAEASRARHEGDLLLKEGHPGQALQRYNLAVHLAPNSPLHLSNRAHALLLLHRPQAALTDADHAVRLRPDWGKGHYRRGMALSALGRHEEAFFALCTSVVIDRNPQGVRHELTRVLHRMLTPSLRRQGPTSTKSPYNNHMEMSPRTRRNRHHHHNNNHHHHNHHHHNHSNSNNNNHHQQNLRNNHHEHHHHHQKSHIILPLMSPNQRHRRTILNTSDCEDNSSGEDEFTQTICHRLLSIPSSNATAKVHTTLDRVYQEVEKLKRIERKPAEVLLPPLTGGTGTGELDCILCCRTLWKPVTTPCGHTYCWMCLDRCLDYSSACPLCVTSLTEYLASSQKTVTEFVERALKIVAPTEYASRAASHRLEMVQGLGLLGSEQIAVFVCTTAFPCVACPLFVYEPRYRLMVRRCVESGVRHFGIAACLNREATGTKRYAEYGTILEIRDRVLMKDGCSILSTVGGRRFRVISGGERDGYDTAQVELVRDSPVQQENIQNLTELHDKVRSKGRRWWSTVSPVQQVEIQRVFGMMPETEDDWSRLPDGPSWTWWFLAILPFGQQLQVGILGTTSLEKRLRAIDKTLDHMEKRQLTIAEAPAEDTVTPSSICRDDRAINETAVSVVQHS